MSRRILKLIALTFAVALALSGCNLIKIDETMDNAEVVATFNGGTVTKGEVMPIYQSNVEYYDYLSSYYGYDIPTDGLMENVVNSLVQNKILLAKAAELGLDVLTEEQEAEVQQLASEEFEQTVQSYWNNFEEDGLTEEEIRTETEAYLAQTDYTVESIAQTYREEKIISNLQEHVYAQVVVSPEDIQSEYEAMVAADQATYADLYTFESSMTTGGVTVAWYPEGYRTVKHILLSFTEEQQTALADIDAQIIDLEKQIAALSSGEAAEETETAEGEEPALTAEQMQTQIDALTADKEAKIAEYTAELQTKIDDIYARLEAGEDFAALMAEYNEDQGMDAEPAKSTGYYVCADSQTWVPSFRDGAMALEKVGDVSEPVATNYGVHIIRYQGDVTPGAVPFEQIKDVAEANVTADKQNAAYNEQAAAWVSEANVKIDLSVVEE